jgi:quinol monooxygenase YgiN
MITLTAVIRCTHGSETVLREALVDVAHYATTREPGTIGYFVSESGDGGVFVTHERYADQAALDAHNNGEGAKEFFARTEGYLDGVDVFVGPELFPG